MDEAHLGYPLKGTEVKVCDDSGKTISEGIGKIYIGNYLAHTGFTIYFSVDEAHLGYPLKATEVKVCDDSEKTITEGIGKIYIGNFFASLIIFLCI